MAVQSYLLGRRGQDDSRTLGPISGARNAGIFLVGISLSVLFLLPSQPVDADESFHLPEFGVPGDHGGFLLDGGGYGKAVGIRISREGIG